MKEKAPVVLSVGTLTKAVRLNDFVDKHGQSTERGGSQSEVEIGVGNMDFIRKTDFARFKQLTATFHKPIWDIPIDIPREGSRLIISTSPGATPISKVEAVGVSHFSENINLDASVILDESGRGHNVTVTHRHKEIHTLWPKEGDMILDTKTQLTGERARRAAEIIVNRAARHMGGVIVAKTKKDLEEV